MNHFKGLNTLNLEPRILTLEEVTTINASQLFSRIKNIIYTARKKVSSPDNSTYITACLMKIMNEGILSLKDGSLRAMKAFYLEVYRPLVLEATTFNVGSGTEDFQRVPDSEWADYFDETIKTADQRISELKYGEDKEVTFPDTSLSGFESPDTASTTMRVIQWGAFLTAGYFAVRYFSKKLK